ncbi:MAG: 50S ribosomal protein L1 [Planctomycetes bacterium ADurb.Bin126]|nr:MAG: 50S ribosomal protein L1 [Planctomycetes bacterium ADurb.Bin126]HOD79825.1 50S ribosomal protein L1 [Phycisphaerae bacterium]HQL72833.1 50S ribosomal protein L1 [Phycisphaerae bacterium]
MGKERSKRYKADLPKVPQGKVPVGDAVAALKTFKAIKFDMTVNLVLHLGIDPKQADQALRGSISLPHGIGSSKKVIAFCDESEIEKAKAAGAIEAGNDELIKKVQDGWTDFDVAVATPAVMKNVSRLGRVLGPQGKMPSPKAGTVVTDVAQAVREYSAGKIEYRNDAGGNIHVPVGKMSFADEKLVDNINAFVSHIKHIKPSAAKGTYIKNAVLSGAMTPGVQMDVQ